MTYEFTSDWFSANIPNWTFLFDHHVGQRPRVLEVGSFEGRSTCWLIERLSTRHGGGEVYCVDPWIGSDFHLAEFDMPHAERLFWKNVKLAQSHFPHVAVHQMKDGSLRALSSLVGTQAGSFDVIYVDGDHTSKAALTDLVLANALCKPEGVIIVDDYLWGYPGSVLSGPKPAVDAFTTIFADEVVQMRHFPIYQVYLKKRPAQ